MDTEWKRFSKEEEESIFQWLVSEIVSQVKNGETRGRKNFHYLTKTKAQKMLFLLCEECYLDLTRMWYMFGGMVMTPFDILAKARNYYDHQTSITKNELLKIQELLGKSRLQKISESLSEIFRKIFLKRMEEVLTDLYEQKAPPLYRELYSHFRSINTLYKEITSPNVRLDYHLRSLLPTFSPWKDVLKIQHYISEFQVEVAGLFSEQELQSMIDYSRLIENIVIQVSWMKYNKRKLTLTHENAINTLLDEFTNIGWKNLATTIGIKTVRGTSADEWRARLHMQKETLKTSVHNSLNKLETLLNESTLRPSKEVIEEFYKKEYQSMFVEALGATKNIEDKSRGKEILNN